MKIMELIDAKDYKTSLIFETLRDFYLIYDEVFMRNYSAVFDCVYVKRLNLPKWEIANLCNISESTLFRYENTILQSFKTCETILNLNKFNIKK